MPNVLVPLAQGCEEMEAVTIIDLLRRAQFNVITAGLESEITPVKCSRGTTLLPDTTLGAALSGNFDMLALPGGLPGSDNLNNDTRIIDLAKHTASSGGYVAAICAAPRVLAKAGLLINRKATSYPGTLDKMDIPGMTYTGAPVTVDGNIITGRGPGPAMDFALTLIAILGGESLREQIETPLLR